MNLNWISDFFSPDFDGWDSEDFKRYGLNENEILYAWALTEVDEFTLEEIKEYIFGGKQDFWQINNSVFYVERNQVRVTNSWREKYFEVDYDQFVKDVNAIVRQKSHNN